MILKEENITLKNEISCLQSKIATFKSTSNVYNLLLSKGTINEAQNRLVKSKNIIIFNNKELPNKAAIISISVSNSLLTDLALNLTIVQVKRIGKYRPGRPVFLLEFKNADDARSLLKCKSKLRSSER